MENNGEEQEGRTTGKGRTTLVLALTIGLIVGAGAGSFVVGPLLAESAEGEVPSGPALEAACQTLFTEWEVKMRPPAPAGTYSIENLVLNPAGSGGTRYLMATVTFGMRTVEGVDAMAARDAEIRDIVLRVLGSKTVAQLADTAMRTQIKEEMRTAVSEIIGERSLVDIYFPQFVIQ